MQNFYQCHLERPKPSLSANVSSKCRSEPLAKLVPTISRTAHAYTVAFTLFAIKEMSIGAFTVTPALRLETSPTMTLYRSGAIFTI